MVCISANNHTENEILEMEISLLNIIDYNITILTPSQICYFLINEFNKAVENKKYEPLDTNIFTNFTNNFIFHSMKESEFINFDFVTLSLSAMICTIDHSNLQYKSPFIEWIVN